MSKSPVRQTGELYVHTGEGNDAISVAMNGIGPHGGWVGISIARMALPDKQKTHEQLNAFARGFAASPDMLQELEDILEWARTENAPLRGQEIESIQRVIAKAKGL